MQEPTITSIGPVKIRRILNLFPLMTAQALWTVMKNIFGKELLLYNLT